MIKNIIFDCGQVLIRYNETEIAAHYVETPEDAELLGRIAMARKYWNRFDEGTLTEADYLEQVKKELPEHLHNAVEKLVWGWIKACPMIPGMEEIVLDIKKSGKPLYLLSNFNQRLRTEPYPILKEFDALVISGEIQKVKPDRAIYDYLLTTYALHPKECIFIDDNPANIAMAESLGIKGYFFDGDAVKLRAYLENEQII
ncbi:MAG: HAD family phosphatase [Clostridia bacterium]|nr:HAD family phosphatase [Clostridia bacterium]